MELRRDTGDIAKRYLRGSTIAHLGKARPNLQGPSKLSKTRGRIKLEGLAIPQGRQSGKGFSQSTVIL